VANTFDWLTAGHGDAAVVHGNGYFLTKQAVGVYTRRPPTAAPAPPDALQERIDARSTTVPVEPSFAGPGTILAYTVTYGRDGAPGDGVMVVDIGGRHTVAKTDAETSGALVSADAVGASVELSEGDGGNTARLA
jgi:acetyl-CoA C-acetyltransferase